MTTLQNLFEEHERFRLVAAERYAVMEQCAKEFDGALLGNPDVEAAARRRFYEAAAKFKAANQAASGCGDRIVAHIEASTPPAP